MATLTALLTLNDTIGPNSTTGLVINANGNLVGTADSVGGTGESVVFEIPKTAIGYSETPVLLASLGTVQLSNLTTDAAGDLFGICYGGNGTGSGGSAVFEIAKTSSAYGSTVLLSPTLGYPYNGTIPLNLVVDSAGNVIFSAGGGSLGEVPN